MLLTGGVQTNIFRKPGTNSFVYVVNDLGKLEQALEFFEGLSEVQKVEVMMDDNPNA